MDLDQATRLAQLKAKLSEYDTQFLDCGSAADLTGLIVELQSAAYNSGYATGRDGEAKVRERAEVDAWNQGFQSGGAVMQRAWRESATQALLEALGKDRGDGPINLGTAGTVFSNS